MFGEIDLIVASRDAVVFVEVKSRRSDLCGSGEEAVTRQKIKRLLKTAECFLAGGGFENKEKRFDVLSIVFGPDDEILSVEHLENVLD